MLERALAGLNDRQAEAVRYCGGPELVLAGAGSGKTRVLTTKIAYLIGEIGVRPHRILALTFTNRAAREMRERVVSLVGEDLRGMQVSTFHSYGLRFLRRYAAELEPLGLPAQFSVCDRSDSRSIIKRAAKDLNIDAKSAEGSGLMERVSRARATADPATLEPNADERSLPLCIAYEKQLRAQGAVDFDDLMMLPLHLMLMNRDVHDRERARIDWVLIDEYQDVSTPQYMLMRSLVGSGVMAVGDPDQSIYGWRGADMSLIMRFESDFPGARVVVLDQNYRSTGNILDAANGVISRNTIRHEKALWTAEGKGERVHALLAKNDDEEREFVADEIERLVGEGYRYGEISLLYRMNALSRGFEQALLERAIPHRIVRGVAFYDRREVKDVLSMLRLAFCPTDRVALERVANLPARGLGKRSVDLLGDYLALAAGSPEEVWSELRASPPLKGKARQGAISFAEQMLVLCREPDMESAIDDILMRFGYRDLIVEEYPDDFEDRLDNIQEILSVVPDEGSIPEILAEAALFTDADADDQGEPGVNMLTLHAAKGLEFPVVFLVGFEEGVFPSGRAIETPEGMEEERRLCYVGMTRARERLYISGAASRLVFGSFRRAPFSRFFRELPDSCVDLDDRMDRGARFVLDRPDRRRRGW